MVSEAMLPRAAVREVEQRLTAAGCPDADFDARELFRLATGRDVRLSDRPLTAEQAAALEVLCTRRAAREPLQYLCGSWPFLDFELAVGPGVLCPRADTEVVAETAAEMLAGVEAPRALDLCAGSCRQRHRDEAEGRHQGGHQYRTQAGQRAFGHGLGQALVHGVAQGFERGLRGLCETAELVGQRIHGAIVLGHGQLRGLCSAFQHLQPRQRHGPADLRGLTAQPFAQDVDGLVLIGIDVFEIEIGFGAPVAVTAVVIHDAPPQCVVGGVLFEEEFEAGDRDDAGGDALGFPLLLRLDRDLDFRQFGQRDRGDPCRARSWNERDCFHRQGWRPDRRNADR